MNKDVVINFLKKNNGYITTKDFINIGISKPCIKEYINIGLVEKVGHGIYMDSNLFFDELFILQKRYPSAIYSYNTAFYLLNITDRAPMNIDITVLNDKKIRGNYHIHRVVDKYYNIGIIEVDSPFGNKVKSYNLERSICDMIKDEDSFDLELRNRILDNYFKSDKKNIDLLFEYSKIFKIYDKVKLIVEVMSKW